MWHPRDDQTWPAYHHSLETSSSPSRPLASTIKGQRGQLPKPINPKPITVHVKIAKAVFFFCCCCFKEAHKHNDGTSRITKKTGSRRDNENPADLSFSSSSVFWCLSEVSLPAWRHKDNTQMLPVLLLLLQGRNRLKSVHMYVYNIS